MATIVVIMDKWKGSLGAVEALEAASAGLREGLGRAAERYDIVTAFCPDGGEGTAAVLPIGGGIVECASHDALQRPLRASYRYNAATGTAAIDLAAASGLTLLPDDRRNPLVTTTFGTGEMIADAIRRGARHIIMCLGGSATNDCGMGLLAALGVTFRDGAGRELSPVGASLGKVATIDTSALDALRGVRFTLLCDVASPLCGPDGAARMFARQKGADDAAVAALEAGAKRFARAIGGEMLMEAPSAGAAGGAAFGLMALLGAEVMSGSAAVLDLLNIDASLAAASLVITGEGSLDRQSLRGKTTGEVLRRCRALGVKVIGIAGRVEQRDELLLAGFAEVVSVNDGYPATTLEEAMRPEVAAERLRATCRRLISRHP